MIPADLSPLLSEFNQPGAPGAAVLVARGGAPPCFAAFGLADLESNAPCSPKTNFRLASVSKQFTTTAILLLVKERKIALDETLTDVFAAFPSYGNRITVRHLLQHTSGIRDYEDLIPAGTVLPVLDRDVLRILCSENSTWFEPGTQYRYSNSGYALLAQMDERRSGRTYAAFLQERIFAPLGMKNTSAYEAGLVTVPNRAFGYSLLHGRWQRTDQNLTSSVLGDGGIYSSIIDLARWDGGAAAGKLLGPRWLRLALTPGPRTEEPGARYGFGWYIGDYRGLKEIWHSGNTIGFTSRIARYPQKKLTVIILCNRTDAPLASLLHQVVDQVAFCRSEGPGRLHSPTQKRK